MNATCILFMLANAAAFHRPCYAQQSRVRQFKDYTHNQHCYRVFLFRLQVLQPFIDPVTRSKAEFINTKDYHATPAKSQEATWGSWASSMFHTKSSSKASAAAAAAPAGSDAEVVLTDAPADGGKGCFRPFLQMYETPFCYDRQRQLLTACGWK
jgi:hypothetical protein